MSYSFLRALTLFLSLFVATTVFADAKLANYLGSGKNPRLTLELSPKNGPGWKPFSIDYQGIGSVPYSTDPTKDWSAWNVKDELGNYYGTINLHSDGVGVSWESYTAGTDGYYLVDIKLSYNTSVKAYQLTAGKIIGEKTDKGPFPDAPIATPAIDAVTGTPLVLQTQGNKIIDNRGNPVILKGMVRPSLEWDQQGQFLSPADIGHIADWQSNVIRIDMNQNYWLNSAPVTEKGSYKQIINAMVYYATQNNMAVILDLHWVEDGHQSNMTNQQSITFWQQVAADYKDFGTVIFELFNEPFNISPTVWLNGDSKYVGYQQLYDAVRSTGANNLVIINGLNYGYDISFVNAGFQVAGNNIIYGSHPYNDKGSDKYSGDGGSFDNNFKGVIEQYPIIFTEFGVNTNSYFPTGYEAVYQRILDYANTNKIHYTGFAWWVDPNRSKVNTFPDLIEDWNGTPINGGVLIYEDMQNNPATALAIH